MKDTILIISSEMAGGGGCYNLRIQQFANYINQTNIFQTKVIVSHIPIFDGNLLNQCKGILVQRPFNAVLPWLKEYKNLQPKFSYKLCFEVDDAFWNIIPDYNPSSLANRDWNAVEAASTENLKYFDCGIVTTDFLANYLRYHHNFWNIVVIPNVADRAIYQSNRKDFFREKPIVLSAGASQHIREPQPIGPNAPQGVTALRGDYCGKWVEFIRHNIDKIDLHYCINVPYFFQDLADKITVHPWKTTGMYSAELNQLRPDIIIAPLKNNDFNRAKSSLKFAEAAASGAILMGSVFPDSPYNMIHPLCKVPDEPTEEQLNVVFNNIKNNWKEILDYQYNFINNNGWWLQSSHSIAKWINAISVNNETLI